MYIYIYIRVFTNMCNVYTHTHNKYSPDDVAPVSKPLWKSPASSSTLPRASSLSLHPSDPSQSDQNHQPHITPPVHQPFTASKKPPHLRPHCMVRPEIVPGLAGCWSSRLTT